MVSSQNNRLTGTTYMRKSHRVIVSIWVEDRYDPKSVFGQQVGMRFTSLDQLVQDIHCCCHCMLVSTLNTWTNKAKIKRFFFCSGGSEALFKCLILLNRVTRFEPHKRKTRIYFYIDPIVPAIIMTVCLAVTICPLLGSSTIIM